MKFKLKYQDGATKKICMWLALIRRQKFSKLVWSGKLNISIKDCNPKLDIISFSGKRDLEEQVLSIYSFLHHVGKPLRWVIYSDGTHSQEDINVLENEFSFVTVRLWNYNPILKSNKLLEGYSKTCSLHKKIYSIAGHDYQAQTIYADSDIVFYNRADSYFNSESLQSGFWYIMDAHYNVEENNNRPLNSGLMLLNKNFDFSLVFEYLEKCNNSYDYFSEQSSFNYSFKKQKSSILSPDHFVVNVTDQFRVSMAFEADAIAMRHYVTPVRHKIWQLGWKWHFKLHRKKSQNY